MADLARKIARAAPPRSCVDGFAEQKAKWRNLARHDRRLTRAQREIAGELAGYFNGERGGCAWVSVATLAGSAEANEKTIRRAFRKFEALGFIETTRRGRATSLYRMTFPPMAAKPQPKEELSGMENDLSTSGQTLSGDFRGHFARSQPEPSADGYADNLSTVERAKCPPIKTGIYTDTSLPSVEMNMLKRADGGDGEQSDEAQTGEIAAAATKGLAVVNVETEASPASLSAAERAEARKRLLERLAALDAAEPSGADPTGATVECGASSRGNAGEADRSASVTAERDENAPAASAAALKSETEKTQAFHEIGKSPERPKRSRAEKRPAAPAGTFDRLWNCYGRKVGKLAAERAFEAALRRGVDPEAIIEAAERFAKAFDASGKEAQFRPHLSSWLNGGRYADEDLPEAPSAGSGMIPADYQPTRDDKVFAVSLGMDLDIMREHWPQFRDAIRSRSAPPADIAAAWRSYVNRWSKDLERQRARDANKPGSVVQAVGELIAEQRAKALNEVDFSTLDSAALDSGNLDFSAGAADMGKPDFSAGALDLDASEYRDETRH